MAKKKLITKVLSCLVVLIILMSMMPVSVFAMDDSKSTDIALSKDLLKSNDTIPTQHQMSFSPLSINEYDIATTSTAPEEDWNQTYGTIYTDTGYSVQQTSDGGYIIAGAKGTSTNSVGGNDAYLIKTYSNGNEEWSKIYPKSGLSQARSVQQTSDGGYIIAGYTYLSEYDTDVYLIKTDSDGSEAWSRTFGGSSPYNFDSGYSVQQTSDGGYIITGRTITYSGLYLVKTYASGDEEWSKAYKNADDIYFGYDVKQTLDGGYIIAGGTPSIYGRVYIHKTDSYGNEEWHKFLEKGSGYSVLQIGEDSFVVAGYTSSSGAGGADMYLAKLKLDYNPVFDGIYANSPNVYVEWERTYGGTESDVAHEVQQTSDGGYVLVGTTSSFGAGKTDAFVVKTDSDGIEMWSKAIGGTDWDDAYSVKQTSDGGYIIAGSTESFGYGKGSDGLYDGDVWLIKLKADGTEEKEPKLCTSPDPPTHDFGDAGVPKPPWYFYITNCGGGKLTWSVSDDRSWITVSPRRGSTTTETDSVAVTIDTQGLSPGTHTGHVTVTSEGGTKKGTITVNVPQGSDLTSLEDALDRYQQKNNEYMLRIASARAESNTRFYKEFGAEYKNNVINYFRYRAGRDGLTADDVNEDVVELENFILEDLDRETAGMIYAFLKEMFGKVNQGMPIEKMYDTFCSYYMGTANMQSNYLWIDGLTLSEQINEFNKHFDRTKQETIQNLEQQGVTSEEVDIFVKFVNGKTDEIESSMSLEDKIQEEFISAILNGDVIDGYAFKTEYTESITGSNCHAMVVGGGLFVISSIMIIGTMAYSTMTFLGGTQVIGGIGAANNAKTVSQLPADTGAVNTGSADEISRDYSIIKKQRDLKNQQDALNKVFSPKKRLKENLNNLYFKSGEITSVIVNGITSDDIISGPSSFIKEGKQTGKVYIANNKNIPFKPYLEGDVVVYRNGMQYRIKGRVTFGDIPEVPGCSEEDQKQGLCRYTTRISVPFEYAVPLEEYCQEYAVNIYMKPSEAHIFPKKMHSYPFAADISGSHGVFCRATPTEIVAEGSIMSGDYETAAHTPNEDTRKVIYSLMYPGSDLDLHLYDEKENHVGINYDTSLIETQIPGATYSGLDYGLTASEWIKVTGTNHGSYTVKVVAMDVGEYGESFSVAATQIPELPAIINMLPDNINVKSYIGETQKAYIEIKEVGDFNDLSSISITTSDLTDGSGGVIPSSSLTFDMPSTNVQAGSAMIVNLTIDIPTDVVEGRTYSGTITAEDDSGAVDNASVNVVISTSQIPTVIFQDDFDIYSAGTFPSSGGWNIKYNGYGTSYQVVDSSQSVSSPNSLKLEGQKNWAAAADHSLSETPDHVIYEADVKVTRPDSGTDGWANAYVTLVDPDVGWGVHYGTVLFGANQLINGKIPYNFDQWYHIKAKVDMINRANDVWIDDEFIGTYNISSTGYYKCIRLDADNSGHTRAWFDNVEVYHKDGSLTNLTVSVLYPNGGENIPIGTQVQVSAHATDDNAVTSVTFYYSSNGGSTWNSIGAGTIVSGTAKDGTWNKTWSTNGLSAGSNYAIKAVASDGTSTDEDQSNGTFSLTGTQPDLIIQDISWSPANPKEGDDITFTVVVKNQGSGTAGTFFVYFYIDDTLVVYYEVSSLSAGTTATRSFQGPPTKCGNVQVRAVADATNVVTDSNEGNNERSEIVSIICPGEPVHNIDTEKNFATIQAAIDDSSTQDGHTITVDAGTYNEHLVIDKSVKLIGANRDTTIIDGSGSGKCVHVTADNVEIRGFTIKKCLYGVYLESSNDTIKNNRVSDHCEGIYLYNSNNNLITHNILTNTTFFFSGIHLSSSNSNVISDNDIFKNYDGIYLYNSNNNLIYHNNLRDNTEQAYDNTGTNSWDNGPTEGGNYWSDHSSCIGNPSDGSQPYYIDSDSVDHYPFQESNGWIKED